jgi:hypothetical protein
MLAHLQTDFLGLSGLQALLGVVVGLLEGWGIFDGFYFAFITGLTIGYGDLAPTRHLTTTLAVVIGFLGIALGGLVAGLAVQAFQNRTRP